MAAKLPAEKQRRTVETSTGYIVRISGGWEVSGEGDTVKEAEAQAEAVYTAHRRNLLGVGEKLPDDVLAEKVAACLYLRNVQVTTGGLHAGVVRWEDVPLPTRNSFLAMADDLLAKAAAPAEPALAVRGEQRY